jgi:predicted RND superfamily exporter protein
MSIGLLVDYIVHILLRYFESKALTRVEKVKETLSSLGAAILSGGLSTLLAILPLAFSTSQIMRTVFIAFIGMITLGCSHGLILLPVVLSIVGPETTVSSEEANRFVAVKDEEGQKLSNVKTSIEGDEEIVQSNACEPKVIATC